MVRNSIFESLVYIENEKVYNIQENNA